MKQSPLVQILPPPIVLTCPKKKKHFPFYFAQLSIY
jgi:hypothetical protein